MFISNLKIRKSRVYFGLFGFLLLFCFFGSFGRDGFSEKEQQDKNSRTSRFDDHNAGFGLALDSLGSDSQPDHSKPSRIGEIDKIASMTIKAPFFDNGATKSVNGLYAPVARDVQAGVLIERVTNENPKHMTYTLGNPLKYDALKNINIWNLTRDTNDFKELGKQLKAFAQVYNDVRTVANSLILDKLVLALYPWLIFPLDDLKGNKERGIALCAYNDGMELSYSSIVMIREVQKSVLPVEVFYIGDSDLSVENQKKLAKLDNIKLVDITKIFNNEILQLKRWAIKPFALLASSFRNVILIDADVVFFQNPDTIFDQSGYKDTGALFFHDRSMTDSVKDWKHGRDIAVDLAGELTTSLQQLRFFNGKTNYEMESGVVAVDKAKSFAAVLAVACLNGNFEERELLYKVTYGEKETFWMGFESVRYPYTFNLNMPGTIGTRSIHTADRVCSRQILHVDDFSDPFRMNGSLMSFKAGEFSRLESYALESNSTNG